MGDLIPCYPAEAGRICSVRKLGIFMFKIKTTKFLVVSFPGHILAVSKHTHHDSSKHPHERIFKAERY